MRLQGLGLQKTQDLNLDSWPKGSWQQHIRPKVIYTMRIVIISTLLGNSGEWLKQKSSESESHSVCPTLCDPMDCIVHVILQARILEWVAFPFSGGSSQPRDRIQVSLTAGRFFTSWATREDPFRYDLNQIPFDYTVEVTNRFKGRSDRVTEEL